MKKSQFITLIFSVVAGLLFSLGMCMCLLPEWNSFTLGVILTSIGGGLLLLLGLFHLIKNFNSLSSINWKIVGKISYGVISFLVFGLGLCFIMVWNLMLVGIIVGVVGLIMTLFLIPLFLGFKK